MIDRGKERQIERESQVESEYSEMSALKINPWQEINHPFTYVVCKSL